MMLHSLSRFAGIPQGWKDTVLYHWFDRPPRSFLIELTNRCNLSCVMCPGKRLAPVPPGF
jgi:hypothetical protein